MKKLHNVVMVLLLLSLSWGQTVQAQDERTKAVPIEFFACTWVKGKDMNDMDKVIEKFRKWTNKNDQGYSAWTLTPQFHNQPGMFDIGWMGSWSDGNAFGIGQDTWLASGGKVAEDFAKVIDCLLIELDSLLECGLRFWKFSFN